MTKRTKYALVLSGGGFKAAFQLGVLNYLNDNWQQITGEKKMHFDLIAAVSGGALNGAFVAMDDLKSLNQLWLQRVALHGASEIYRSDFLDAYSQQDHLVFQPNLKKIAKRLIPDFKLRLSLRDKLSALLSKKARKRVSKRILKELQAHIVSGYRNFKSIAENSPLRQKLELHLDRSKMKDTRFFPGFVSLDSGQYHAVDQNAFNSDQDFQNAVLASTSIPLVWNPVPKIGYTKNGKTVVSKNNVDGGVRNISPLADVIYQINQDSESEYKILIVNCHSKHSRPESFDNKSAGAILSRSIYEIAFNEIFQNDLDHFLQVNEIVKQAEAWDGEITLFNSHKQPIKAFDAVVIGPDTDADLGNALVANKKLITKRYDHGYEKAARILTKTPLK